MFFSVGRCKRRPFGIGFLRKQCLSLRQFLMSPAILRSESERNGGMNIRHERSTNGARTLYTTFATSTARQKVMNIKNWREKKKLLNLCMVCMNNIPSKSDVQRGTDAFNIFELLLRSRCMQTPILCDGMHFPVGTFYSCLGGGTMALNQCENKQQRAVENYHRFTSHRYTVPGARVAVGNDRC